MRGRSEVVLAVAVVAACTRPDAVREHAADLRPELVAEPGPKPVAEPEPITDGWRWTPDLDDLAFYADDGSFARPFELERCRNDECTRLATLREGTRLGKLAASEDGRWALLWYALGERESILALFDLEVGRLACATDFSGVIDRPSSLEWVGDAIVHSWSAGTHLNEVAIWSTTCQQVDSLGAAQVFLAPDLAHALRVVYEPGRPYALELVDRRRRTQERVHELGEGEFVESVGWAPRAATVVIGPGERSLRVALD